MGRLPMGLGDGVVSGHDCCSRSISIYCLTLNSVFVGARGTAVLLVRISWKSEGITEEMSTFI